MKRYHKNFPNKCGVTLLELMIGLAIGVIATVVLFVGISFASMNTARTSVYQRAGHINAAVVTGRLALHSQDRDFTSDSSSFVDILRLCSEGTTKYEIPFGFEIEKHEDGVAPPAVAGGIYDSLEGLSFVQSDLANEASSDNRSVMLCRKPSSPIADINGKYGLQRGIKYKSDGTEEIVWCYTDKSNGVVEETTDVVYNSTSAGELDWDTIEHRPSNGGTN